MYPNKMLCVIKTTETMLLSCVLHMLIHEETCQPIRNKYFLSAACNLALQNEGVDRYKLENKCQKNNLKN